MYNMNSILRDFYGDEIAVSEEVRQTLREARAENEERLQRGLAKNGKPKVKRFVPQGSYRMKTMVQQPGYTYDIDNGALFTLESLRANNPMLTAKQAREMVCSALEDESFFKTAPEVRTNCVRVHYPRGYWVDIPVYRELIDSSTQVPYLELASNDWKLSDPEGVTTWFRELEETLSPDADQDGDPQFRRVVALIKGLAKTRTTWNWPTGFMISVLVSDCYNADRRDDVALRQTLVCVHDWLAQGRPIKHPRIDDERLDVKGNPDKRCVEMREKLKELLGYLTVLDDPSCDEDTAAEAWDRVYAVTYFRDRRSKLPKALTFAGPTGPSKFERGDGGRYG